MWAPYSVDLTPDRCRVDGDLLAVLLAAAPHWFPDAAEIRSFTQPRRMLFATVQAVTQPQVDYAERRANAFRAWGAERADNLLARARCAQLRELCGPPDALEVPQPAAAADDLIERMRRANPAEQLEADLLRIREACTPVGSGG